MTQAGGTRRAAKPIEIDGIRTLAEKRSSICVATDISELSTHCVRSIRVEVVIAARKEAHVHRRYNKEG